MIDIEINKCEWKGFAVLPDGTRMPYAVYTGKNHTKPHENWTRVRFARFKYDNHMCVFCGKQLTEYNFYTHHVNYVDCGHEELKDVVTCCYGCHDAFHRAWKFAEYFKEDDENHWNDYSLEDTAKLCGSFLHEDYWFGGDLNCCNVSKCAQLIDDYFVENELIVPPVINPHDIELYFRNKRYDVLLNEEANGLVLDRKCNDSCDRFLDERFGKKGGSGGNPNRSNARAFIINHDSESFHRNRWYLRYINILMKEAEKYEQA